MIKDQVKDALIGGLNRTGVVDFVTHQLTSRIPNVIEPRRYTPEFLERLLELTAEGYVPEMVVGHFNHLDPVVISEPCNDLVDIVQKAGYGEYLGRFAVTLAKSAARGQQSKLMEMFYAPIKDHVNKRHVDFVEVTRKKDVDVYNMTKDHMEVRPLVEKALQGGTGWVLMAGGSVQPGRHPKGATGEDMFGLQEIVDTDILDIYKRLERISERQVKKHGKGQRPYFLPVGIKGQHEFFSSDTLLLQPKGLVSLFTGLSDVLSDRVKFRRRMVGISVGMPITDEDMQKTLGSDWRNDSMSVNKVVMTEVARNLPPYAQGFYRQFV